MRIARVRVRGYRALRDLPVSLDELTVIIGANSTGKSSFLNALTFFFDASTPTDEDVNASAEPPEISVEVAFTDLSAADRAVLGRFVAGEELVLTRRWTPGGSMRVTGRGRMFPPFGAFWETTNGNVKKSVYAQLRKEYGLRPAVGVADQTAALLEWQSGHDADCVEAEVDAADLFAAGPASEGKLTSRFRFVAVPALRDAAAETRDVRGTIFSRLLAGLRDRMVEMDEQLEDLRSRMQAEYEEIVQRSQGGALEELAEQFGLRLRQYVPSGAIRLQNFPAEVAVEPPRVELRAGEHEELTDLVRQGHGFGRAFLMAGLQLLSEMDMPREDPPALFLSIEEPELFQHPTRARFMARVLDRLAARTEARVQVCYATHSPYFIDPARYERLRLFRRSPDGTRTATAASRDAVAGRLRGVVPEEQMQRRLERTLDGAFNEAFFAAAVILGEGRTETLGALRGVADAMRLDLDAMGVAAIVGGGKTGLPVRWAILDALEIPAFVIFDGDADKKKEAQSAARQNQALLRALGEKDPPEFPDDSAGARWVCFEHDLEAYLRREFPAWDERCDAEAGHAEWRAKSDPVYRAVARSIDPPPALLADLVRRAASAAGASEGPPIQA